MMRKHWITMIACIAAVFAAAPAFSAPSYFSYWGLGRNITEVQDHVNLYWDVSWIWDSNEIVSQLADAKARGMRAIVHTEFAFFNGSGQYSNTCPYTIRTDAASRWDAFATTLTSQGLLDTVAAFYPMDEPDGCGLTSANILSVLNIIRAHPLTSAKPLAVIFGCDIAQKYGGAYQITGGHQYGDALRAYDWVGVDCYGNNIFTDPAWTTPQFDLSCFCFRRIPGPTFYDNFKAQLMPAQRVILVPQGFIEPEPTGLPDDPQLYASMAAADPSVLAIVPFTWFDQPAYAGIRSQPDLAAQWRSIGRSISMMNPPTANPPLPPAIPPRLKVGASDVAHFFVYDLSCNSSNADSCTIQLHWQTLNTLLGTQVFIRQGTGSAQLLTCSTAKSSIDIPSIAAGVNYTFDLYQMATCAATIPAGPKPVASLNVSLITTASGGLATILEFYNAGLDHYFISWMSEEIAKLDAGTAIKGWARTGQSFKTYTMQQPGTSPVCRFYIPPELGDSHFFGRGVIECNETAQKNPTFILEDPAFMYMFLPVAGVCPPNTTEVYRVFSNRRDANHRYMTDPSVRNQMVAMGWVAEGDGPNLVTMCAPQ